MDLYEQLPSSGMIHQPEYKFLLDAATFHGITCLDFLSQSPSNLMKTINRSINEIIKFQAALRNEFELALADIKIQDITTLKEDDKPRCFTTGNLGLDKLLGGGIYSKGITEIFGESSTGKSQLLLQLALSVQLPEDMNGLNGQSVYITTEGDLPTRRLKSIIEQSSLFKDEGGDCLVSQKKIFTVTCNDWANQEHVTTVQLPVLLERHPSIKLVIIDSISHHLRVELQSKTFQESRSNRYIIDSMAENLLSLAQKHNLAIVVANQVSDKLLPEKPIRQDFKDYDYQLGWNIGWKNSTIFYRHKFNEIEKYDETILSDDEDYTLIVDQVARKLQQNVPASVPDTNNKDPAQSVAALRTEALRNNVISQQNSPQPTQSKTPVVPSQPQPSAPFLLSRRKREVDTKVPNLGLTWANHLMTRIKLEKRYKASPMVRTGEFNYNNTTDTSQFWQVQRNLKLVFSTYAVKGEMNFAISGEGVISVQ
ncbi:putative DNA-dependent ATPase RAD57 [Kluyveromyces lactis]|uniref:KLLA0E17513p n=1 Tax=Kluyveromyces lactis (strain ATCC 8585 / CBS 2359 / DSM 70799 / NBRC 1267 / NRRL Y-1140 / WM37) TaxID=284590 RepID=Q6CMV0_KLULA|nr:uncharacterized protein KLLA0_E17513g [Kluyveromyces lactis]CAG99826.1 KLLA0E17513p [Kluyveromyces lactis]|eukprot:XP_454739.1 uncharacterized protein KLLA0_E17513g [Kluyveromyces lactis]